MTTAEYANKKYDARTETRARLVRIGTEILSEKGFGSTGLEEILDRAQVPKGSFYYYFDSKASFGFAVIENYEYLWAQKLTRLLKDPAVAPLKRIDDYIAEGVRGLEKYSFRRGCLIGNLGQELAALDDEFRSRILKVFDSWASYVADCLNEAKALGDLPIEFSIEEVAKFFWIAWEGAVLQAKLERSVEPIERFRSVMFKYILAKS
jgi:TetR/AcrR family transcriptional regulator, transcriptional repressor for nem operon